MRGPVQREDWDRRYAEPNLLWSATPNRFLVREAIGLAPARALDLACGEGRNALWLADLGWQLHVYGRASPEIARLCVERALPLHQLAWRPAMRDAGLVRDAVYLVRPDGLVLVLYLQLPAAERRLVLSRAAGALAPGGTFFLVGHDLTNLRDGVGGPSDPEVLYTPDDIVAEVPGLVVVKAERVLRDVADADRPAIDALVRARRPER